jgi:hypothetical protein
MFPMWLGNVGTGSTEIQIVKEIIEVSTGVHGAIPRIYVRAKVVINNKRKKPTIKVKLI